MQQFFSKRSAMMLILCGALPMVAAAVSPNPFQILTEQQLSSQQIQLDLFWQKQVTQGSLTGTAGVALHYAYHIPANAKASIVLVNGRTESVLKYQEMYFELAKQGYAIFSYDHRGQGLSGRLTNDRQVGHVVDFQHYVQDLKLFVDHFAAQMPGAKLLLAHSMGGAVSSLYLAQHRDTFIAAAMSAPMHAPNATVVFGEKDGCYLAAAASWSCKDCYVGFTDQPYQAGPFVGNIYTQSELRYQRFREQFQLNPAIQLGAPSWQWLTESCAVAEQMPAMARQINIPVLILQAGDDEAVVGAAQDEFCQALGNFCQGGQVSRYEGARHEFFIEADVYRIPALTEVLTFFQQQLAKTKG